jgi:hypothetical protein
MARHLYASQRVKIMILGNSELHGGQQLKPEQVWTALIVEPLSRELGEPVEIFARTIWPADELPSLIGRWIDREQPDVVVIDVNSYWYMYESVPERFNRWLGKIGGPIARSGAWAGRTPWVSYNPVARGIRRLAQVTIGGDTLFSTGYVIDLMRQCVKVAVQGEDRVVQVRTPKRGKSYAYGRRGAVRRDRRKAEVDAGLRQFCLDLHVSYVGPGDPEPPSGASRQGDGLHSDAEGQKTQAIRWQRRLMPLCLAARHGTPVPLPAPVPTGGK